MIRIEEDVLTNGVPLREEQIRAAVMREFGRAPVEWSAVRCQNEKHVGILYVMADALQMYGRWNPTEICDCGKHQGVLYVPETESELVDCQDRIRINVTPTLAQHLCDIFGILLPTTKISDMIYDQRSVKLPPFTSTPNASMDDTSRMVWHSNQISRAKGEQCGLACNLGKHWVFTNTLLEHPGRAANYAWYDPSAPYLAENHKFKLWQPLSWAHNLLHVDYSQTLVGIGPQMRVDSKPIPTWDVLHDAELASLISYEGILQIDRIPGVSPDPDAGCCLIFPWIE